MLFVIMDSMFIRIPLLCRNILFDYLYTCIYRNLLLSRLNSQSDICKKNYVLMYDEDNRDSVSVWWLISLFKFFEKTKGFLHFSGPIILQLVT